MFAVPFKLKKLNHPTTYLCSDWVLTYGPHCSKKHTFLPYFAPFALYFEAEYMNSTFLKVRSKLKITNTFAFQKETTACDIFFLERHTKYYEKQAWKWHFLWLKNMSLSIWAIYKRVKIWIIILTRAQEIIISVLNIIFTK